MKAVAILIALLAVAAAAVKPLTSEGQGLSPAQTAQTQAADDLDFESTAEVQNAVNNILMQVQAGAPKFKLVDILRGLKKRLKDKLKRVKSKRIDNCEQEKDAEIKQIKKIKEAIARLQNDREMKLARTREYSDLLKRDKNRKRSKTRQLKNLRLKIARTKSSIALGAAKQNSRNAEFKAQLAGIRLVKNALINTTIINLRSEKKMLARAANSKAKNAKQLDNKLSNSFLIELMDEIRESSLIDAAPATKPKKSKKSKKSKKDTLKQIYKAIGRKGEAPINIQCADTVKTALPKKRSAAVVICPANCISGNNGKPYEVFGSNPYSRKSPICIAAIHSGAIDEDKGGKVEVVKSPRRRKFKATTANKVVSKAKGKGKGVLIVTNDENLLEVVTILDNFRIEVLNDWAKNNVTVNKFRTIKSNKLRLLKQSQTLLEKGIKGLVDSISRNDYERTRANNEAKSYIAQINDLKKEHEVKRRLVNNQVQECNTAQSRIDAQISSIIRSLKTIKVLEKILNAKFGDEAAPASVLQSASSAVKGIATWKTGRWRQCSRKCINVLKNKVPVRKRKVFCAGLDGKKVKLALCKSLIKPAKTEACDKLPKCKINCKFDASPRYTACAATCKALPSDVNYKDGKWIIRRQAAYGGKPCPMDSDVPKKECSNLPLCTRTVSFPKFNNPKSVISASDPDQIGMKEFSIAGFVKPRKYAYGIVLAKEKCGESQNQFRLETHADGLLAFITDNVGERTATSTAPKSPDMNKWLPEFVSFSKLKLKKWNHFVLSRTNSFDNLGQPEFTYRLWVNGKKDRELKVPAVAHTNSYNVRLGTRMGCSDEPIEAKTVFKGRIAGVKWYDSIAFNRKEDIQSLRNSVNPKTA